MTQIGCYEKLLLKKDMKDQYPGMSYIRTKNVNQDGLENFYSKMRALGCNFTQFGAVAYKERLRCLIIGADSRLSVATASVHCPADKDCVILTAGIAQAMNDLAALEGILCIPTYIDHCSTA